MEFTTINKAMQYIRGLSEEAMAEIGDVEVWQHGGTRWVWVDVDGIVDNNESFDGYEMIGTVQEVLC